MAHVKATTINHFIYSIYCVVIFVCCCSVSVLFCTAFIAFGSNFEVHIAVTFYILLLGKLIKKDLLTAHIWYKILE